MSFTIALAGNPNCGKTTMFNELTGASQYVGNWPGVTVEKKDGTYRKNKEITIADLPGVYSLSPYTLEEVVTRDYLLSKEPDAVINIIDASNIERNLYLTTQLLELHIPVVIALNMIDVVRKRGDRIQVKELEKILGCTIIETSALKGEGLEEAVKQAVEDAKSSKRVKSLLAYSKAVREVLEEMEEFIPAATEDWKRDWYKVKLLERDERVLKQLNLNEAQKKNLDDRIEMLEEQEDDDAESIITNERYGFIADIVKKTVIKKKVSMTASDKIDRIVTNRFLAIPIFAVVMGIVYFVSVTWLGTIVTDWTNDTLFGGIVQPAVGNFLSGIGAAEWLNGLVVDGIIGGVGAVLGFVPQMLILFFFLSILEDCGYMARVAFIMDRIFRKFGLSGKSFIPMLISSGCGVPGIMASKTIENEKDRRMTIMTTTFVPCGAKLPIIALIGGAMFPNIWFMGIGMYLVGVVAVIVSGVILKKTKMFAGDPAPFVLELPQYHIPAAKSVLIHMWERGKAFIIKAGTVIFVACGLIWFLSNFGFTSQGFGLVEESKSILAAIGQVIAPLFAPLGFGNWRAAVATVSGLVAKENVVGTFGVLLGLGGSVTETDSGLLSQIQAMFPYGAAAASFLIFNLLCAPCFAAIGAIKREMASTKWTWFAIIYQTVFAYGAALIIYQIGGVLTGAVAFGPACAAAIVLLLVFLYLLLRPNRQKSVQYKTVKATA